MKPTPPEIRHQIEAVMNADWLSYLYGRWQDEKEYEDFEDYKKHFAKMSGFTVTSAKKSPFSFTFSVPGFPAATYEIKVTARSVAWRRAS